MADALTLGRVLAQQDPSTHLATARVVRVTAHGVTIAFDAQNEVTVPTLEPVYENAVVWVLARGSSIVVLGLVNTQPIWKDIKLASGNWTIIRTPQWRQEGDRIFLRGAIQRTTSTFTAGGNFLSLGVATNPPVSPRSWILSGIAQVAAQTPDFSAFAYVIDSGTNVLRSSSGTHALAVGDLAVFEGLSWSIH